MWGLYIAQINMAFQMHNSDVKLVINYAKLLERIRRVRPPIQLYGPQKHVKRQVEPPQHPLGLLAICHEHGRHGLPDIKINQRHNPLKSL
jgi:hypothetical protein